jgi:Fe-S cluster assembly iron-binding protein IscA
MVTITKSAMEILEETLKELSTDPEMVVRLIPSSTNPEQLDLILDKERKGDQVLESESGVKLLLIGIDIAEDLEGMVFDFEETPEGPGFIITDYDLEEDRE